MSLSDLSAFHEKRKLNRPDDDDTVDVVAVHGLNGDPIEAWRDPQSGVMWLQHLLPHSIKSARVLTFGYHDLLPTTPGGACTESIQQHAHTLLARLQADRSLEDRQRRPIVFICHGLGGLLVKKALAYASTCISKHLIHLYSIFASTYAVLFFGTPHYGTERQYLRSSPPTLRSKILFKSSREADSTHSVQRDFEALRFISEQFSPLMKQFHIFFFWEQLPTQFTDSVDFVVDESSAAPIIDNTERSGIHADHAGMVRFSHSNSSDYRTVIEALGRYCRTAPGTISIRWQDIDSRLSRSHSAEHAELLGLGFDVHNVSTPFEFNHQAYSRLRNKHFYIPQIVSSIFTGREEESIFLRDAFFHAQEAGFPRQQRRVVIYGIAGSGKTQFCCKFAQDYREKFWGVFWVDASSYSAVKSSFAGIGKIGNLEATESAGKHWLSNLEHPWLLIINNADDPSLELSSIFPEGDRGLVLVTTRNPNFAVDATAGSLEFEGMRESEGLSLFLRAAGARQPWDIETESTGLEITRALGHIALALIHAGAYVLQKLCEMKDYLSFHREQKKRLSVNTTRSQPSVIQGSSIFSTWELSRRTIESQQTPASQDALELLNIVGFFHFEHIRLDIFTRALDNRTKALGKPNKWTPLSAISASIQDRVRPTAQLPGFLRQQPEDLDRFRVRRALQDLIAIRLIYYDGKDSSFSLHPLVHEWIRDRMGRGQQMLWAQIALNTLGEAILLPPEDSGPAHEDFRRDLLPHLENCLEMAPIKDFQFSSRYGGLKLPLTVIFQPALLLQFRADVLRAAKFGYVFAERGRFAVAADLLLKAKDALVQSRGYENDLTLKSMIALSAVYWGLGRLEEAVTLQNRVVDSRTKLLGPNHRDTLQAMNQLGRSFWLHGQYHEALDLQKETTSRMKMALGPADADTLAALDNFGVVLGSWQMYQESMEVHQQVFDSRMESLGADDLNTLETMNNLAMALLDLKNYQRAKELITNVYEMRKQKIGKEHPYTLWALCNLAKVDTEMGNLEEAEQALVPGVAAAKRSLGDGHLGVLMGCGQLALVYARQKRFEEAETLTQDTLARLEENRGKAHPDTVFAMWKLAQLYEIQHKYAKAVDMSELAVERVKLRLTEEHPLGKSICGYLKTLKAQQH